MNRKILINGKIYTEDTRKPWAEAVAIDGNIFVAVGTNDEVIKYAKFNFGEYETVDLLGKTVLPGIVNGHTHPSAIVKGSWAIYGPDATDKEELYKNIREALVKYPKEDKPYFVYNGYHADTFNGEGIPLKELDELIPDRPARINDDSGHGCTYNSVALNMLKDENGIPHSVSPISGQTFFKDENGEYTGKAFQTFNDGDIGVFEAIGWFPPKAMTDEFAEPIHNIMRHYGYISYMDAITQTEGDLAYISQLDKEGRLYFYYEGTSILNNIKNIDEAIATARDWQKKYESEHVRVRIIKFFCDGSNEAGDVLSLQPFANDPEGKNYGHCNFEMEDMRDVIVRLNKERLDLHVHIVCDGTLRRMLDAVEAAQNICGDDWCIRVTIAHLETMHPDDAKRFKKLGVYADMTPHWFGVGSPASLLFLGKERWDKCYDFSQFKKDDVDYGFSDDNMNPFGKPRITPFLGIEIAKTGIEPGIGPYPALDTKKYPNGRLPEEAKFTVEESIHAFTWKNANRMRLLDKLGSIEVGKRACLVVLDKDIFTIPDNELHTIEPVCTYFDGQELHIANPLDK
ncbi:MAG: amidohydrolase family protein [Lachnospiraceae bacterium]|nr:amidohydrolase family protein [Lachnospiraceae bacterium]